MYTSLILYKFTSLDNTAQQSNQLLKGYKGQQSHSKKIVTQEKGVKNLQDSAN